MGIMARVRDGDYSHLGKRTWQAGLAEFAAKRKSKADNSKSKECFRDDGSSYRIPIAKVCGGAKTQKKPIETPKAKTAAAGVKKQADDIKQAGSFKGAIGGLKNGKQYDITPEMAKAAQAMGVSDRQLAVGRVPKSVQADLIKEFDRLSGATLREAKKKESNVVPAPGLPGQQQRKAEATNYNRMMGDTLSAASDWISKQDYPEDAKKILAKTAEEIIEKAVGMPVRSMRTGQFRDAFSQYKSQIQEETLRRTRDEVERKMLQAEAENRKKWEKEQRVGKTIKSPSIMAEAAMDVFQDVLYKTNGALGKSVSVSYLRKRLAERFDDPKDFDRFMAQVLKDDRGFDPISAKELKRSVLDDQEQKAALSPEEKQKLIKERNREYRDLVRDGALRVDDGAPITHFTIAPRIRESDLMKKAHERALANEKVSEKVPDAQTFQKSVADLVPGILKKLGKEPGAPVPIVLLREAMKGDVGRAHFDSWIEAGVRSGRFEVDQYQATKTFSDETGKTPNEIFQGGVILPSIQSSINTVLKLIEE
jgi:hypothetical protein